MSFRQSWCNNEMILDQPIFRSLVYIYHFYRRINRKLVRRVLESNHRNYKQITERLLFLNTFNFLRDCQLIREKNLCQLRSHNSVMIWCGSVEDSSILMVLLLLLFSSLSLTFEDLRILMVYHIVYSCLCFVM